MVASSQETGKIGGTMKRHNKIPLLHIFGQHQWHDECYIVANRDGLLCLKKALETALDMNSCFSHNAAEVFINDGEGYTIEIILDDSEWLGKFWTALAVPYTKDFAKENRDDAIYPWRIETEKEEK